MLSLYNYIKYNIMVFTYEFNKANYPSVNKLFCDTITNTQELLQSATNELAKTKTTVDPILLTSFISLLNDTIPIVQSVIDYIDEEFIKQRKEFIKNIINKTGNSSFKSVAEFIAKYNNEE